MSGRIPAPDALGRKLWTCDVCGHTGQWTDSWCWYGAEAKRGSPHEMDIRSVVCSEKCMRADAQRRGVPTELLP